MFLLLRGAFLYLQENLDGSVVTIGRKELVLSSELASDGLDGLGADLGERLGALVVGGSAGATLVLKLVDDVGVLPSDFGGETAEDAVSAIGTETEGAEGVGDDEALNLVEGRGDSLEDLEAGEGGHSLGGLVGQHTTDNTPEDLGGRAVMEGTVTGVGVGTLTQESKVLELVTVQGAADVDSLATDSNDLLSRQELLGDGGGQATQQMTTAVNNHLLLEHFGFLNLSSGCNLGVSLTISRNRDVADSSSGFSAQLQYKTKLFVSFPSSLFLVSQTSFLFLLRLSIIHCTSTPIALVACKPSSLLPLFLLYFFSSRLSFALLRPYSLGFLCKRSSFANIYHL